MTYLNRRHVLVGVAAGAITARRAFGQPALQQISERLKQAQQDGKVSGLHALLVSQAGKLVFEHYGEGEDESWGQPLGTIVFAPGVLHDLRSVSKSVVGLLYGIALAAGKAPPPEAKLYDQFPEYADLARQAGRDRLTMHHVLSMTLGLEWDELTIAYGDPRNSENAMEAAPDRFRFILERPLIGEPGVKWTYCGGATALLARLIAKGTGEELLAYARRVLFDPLEFGPAEWTRGDDGEPHAASGLRLLPRDMLKIGQLVLAGGKWNGRQIVPSDWVTRVTTPVVAIDRDFSYGYHWYMGDIIAGTPPQPHHWMGGIGWGDQRLYALPALDLAVAINCGNYHKSLPEQSSVNRALVTEVVLPSFV
ncbi:MAG: serine hydrolase [Hyphomicrobiales bacterium]|nr:serine hydrolase [Hyphomicrobiales bacterium]MBV9429663.1 serine hydrolase [Bradyrhizobiaceae bacterium]